MPVILLINCQMLYYQYTWYMAAYNLWLTACEAWRCWYNISTDGGYLTDDGQGPACSGTQDLMWLTTCNTILSSLSIWWNILHVIQWQYDSFVDICVSRNVWISGVSYINIVISGCILHYDVDVLDVNVMKWA